jgi:hypothetical protein
MPTHGPFFAKRATCQVHSRTPDQGHQTTYTCIGYFAVISCANNQSDTRHYEHRNEELCFCGGSKVRERPVFLWVEGLAIPLSGNFK